MLLRHGQAVVQGSEAPLTLVGLKIWPGNACVPEPPCRNRHTWPRSCAAGAVDVHPEKSRRNLLRRGNKLVLIHRKRRKRGEK